MTTIQYLLTTLSVIHHASACVNAPDTPNHFALTALGPEMSQPVLAGGFPSPVTVYAHEDAMDPVVSADGTAVFYCTPVDGRLFVYHYRSTSGGTGKSWDHYEIPLDFLESFSYGTILKPFYCGPHHAGDTYRAKRIDKVTSMAATDNGIVFVGYYKDDGGIKNRLFAAYLTPGQQAKYYIDRRFGAGTESVYQSSNIIVMPGTSVSPITSWGGSAGNSGRFYYTGSDRRVYNHYWSSNTWVTFRLHWKNNVDGQVHRAQDGKIYYRGTDEKAWFHYWSNGWHADALNVNCPKMATNVEPVMNHAVTQLFYKHHASNSLHSLWWNNGQWRCTGQVGSTNNVRDQLTNGPDGKLYYVGTDDHIWVSYWHDSRWHNGQVNNNCRTAARTRHDRNTMLVTSTDSQVHIYYRNSALELDYIYWSNSAQQWKCNANDRFKIQDLTLPFADARGTDGICSRVVFPALGPGGQFAGMAQLRIQDAA